MFFRPSKTNGIMGATAKRIRAFSGIVSVDPTALDVITSVPLTLGVCHENCM